MTFGGLHLRRIEPVGRTNRNPMDNALFEASLRYVRGRARCLLTSLGLALCITACDGGYPRDAEHTLDRVQRGPMRVGISHDPPLVQARGAPSGAEVALVEQLAGEQGAKVEWVYGAHDALMTQLQQFQLAAVVGGHHQDSPWQPEVSWSREYLMRSELGLQRRQLALPPGENAWQLQVDQFLLDRQRRRQLR